MYWTFFLLEEEIFLHNMYVILRVNRLLRGPDVFKMALQGFTLPLNNV